MLENRLPLVVVERDASPLQARKTFPCADVRAGRRAPVVRVDGSTGAVVVLAD